MAEGDTLQNVLIGTAINVFGGPVIPGATIIGGAVAAYLQGGSRKDGVTIGALTGLVSLLPLLAFGVLFGNIFVGLFLGGFGVPRAFSGLGVFVLIAVVISAVIYTVAFSAAGGWLGNYVRYDTDLGN
jgi:hypothetical protein